MITLSRILSQIIPKSRDIGTDFPQFVLIFSGQLVGTGQDSGQKKPAPYIQVIFPTLWPQSKLLVPTKFWKEIEIVILQQIRVQLFHKVSFSELCISIKYSALSCLEILAVSEKLRLGLIPGVQHYSQYTLTVLALPHISTLKEFLEIYLTTIKVSQ